MYVLCLVSKCLFKSFYSYPFSSVVSLPWTIYSTVPVIAMPGKKTGP